MRLLLRLATRPSASTAGSEPSGGGSCYRYAALEEDAVGFESTIPFIHHTQLLRCILFAQPTCVTSSKCRRRCERHMMRMYAPGNSPQAASQCSAPRQTVRAVADVPPDVGWSLPASIDRGDGALVARAAYFTTSRASVCVRSSPLHLGLQTFLPAPCRIRVDAWPVRRCAPVLCSCHRVQETRSACKWHHVLSWRYSTLSSCSLQGSCGRTACLPLRTRFLLLSQ